MNERVTQRTIRETRVDEHVDDAAPAVRNINVADPSSVVVSANLGEPGSRHDASVLQTTRIRQQGGETDEETDTVRESS